MLHLVRLTTWAGLALALGVLGPPAIRAEDPPVPAPAPSAEQAAALAKAKALNAQVLELYEQGKYAEATPLAREALEIRERVLGKDHADLAESLSNLAQLLAAQGAYAEARPLYERALAIDEKALGRDHPHVATSLGNLASLLYAAGAYAEAQPLFERALAIDERALGTGHLDVAGDLNNLAAILKSRGVYAEARPLYERALAIYEEGLGQDHPDVATGLNNLATLLMAQGAYAEARPLYERALTIREKALGHDHPYVATSLNNLAMLLDSQGAYAEARTLFERALAIHERALGKDHPSVGIDLNNLAALLRHQGAYTEARPLLERALAINEMVLGKDHPTVATSLSNLGLLLLSQRAYGEARPLLERALAIAEKALGSDHPHVAGNLNNLALILTSQGAYGEARPLLERALAIREKALGKDHPDVATDLDSLASLAYVQGALAEGRPLLERALAIRERALGKDHPNVATSLNNLASLLDGQGAYGAARPLLERALALSEAHARGQLSALSALERLALQRSTRYRLNNWLLFAPRAGLSGYSEVLRFRGLVARAEAAERILARRASGEERLMLEQLAAAQHVAARLANKVPPAARMEARATWQRLYAEAAAERERLTRELSTRSAPLRVALERLDLREKDVQAQLGSEDSLVEVLRVRDRYLAWIVHATGEPVRIEIGAAEAIEKACGEFVSALEDRATDAPAVETRAAAGAALRALVWAPIEAKLGADVKRVVVCPDAALAAVPFAALPGKGPGTSLLDDLALSYVTNAQDLVPWDDAVPLGTGALLVGGVDYESAEAPAAEQPLSEHEPALAVFDRAPRGGTFLPLPQTRIEAEGLWARLGQDSATLLVGSNATESAVRASVRGRRLLHIATHGFAREDLLAGLYDRKSQAAWTSADMERQLGAGHDPMLLSGLALAGANPREGGAGDDGILTALEASYLDLDGVDLVTLSACETAKGTAESGEGVQGLVSAFQLAGARHVLASLWKVDDEATRLLMEGVYERLLRKESPLSHADALREAALALRDRQEADGKRRFAAPRYWAAFVAYGR